MSRSAVRVRSSALLFTCKIRKKHGPRCWCWGIVSTTSAVDYPKALSLALACYKWLRGTAVCVGAAPSKKLRQSAEKVNTANFGCTEFSEVRLLGTYKKFPVASPTLASL